MILSSLYINQTPNMGRGVFSSKDLRAGIVIEVSPVIILSGEERLMLDRTLLHDYIFIWGKEEKQCCVALGYVSIYNHNYLSNAEYGMNYDSETIQVKTIRAIKSGEEIFINYNGDWNNEKPVWFDPAFK